MYEIFMWLQVPYGARIAVTEIDFRTISVTELDLFIRF